MLYKAAVVCFPFVQSPDLGREEVGEVQIFFGRDEILLYDHLLLFFNLGLRASTEGQLDVSVKFPDLENVTEKSMSQRV